MTPEEAMSLVQSLSPQEKLALAQSMADKTGLWVPQPGPQKQAYTSEADVVLYGGAAGGGKTDLAVGLALMEHTRTLFIRKEGIQLKPVIDRISELLGGRKGYNGQDNIWRHENKTIQFGGVPNLGDETKYQGNPRDLLVLDEAANLLEFQAKFLMGWVRTTDPNQRTRVLMCSNPPTSAEGRWLIEYFAPWLDDKHPNPADPGELRWFANIRGEYKEVPNSEPFEVDGEEVVPQSRTFIPAKVSDNKFLRGTAYVATLQALPEPLRSQMLYGDFKAGIEDDAWQCIPTKWVDLAMERWHPRNAKTDMHSMGVDVSRGGDDESVIATLHIGKWFDKIHTFKGADITSGPALGAEVIRLRRDAAVVHVDAVGVGTSVVDFLHTNAIQHEPISGQTRSHAADKTGIYRFRNLRSELYWLFREALDPESGIPVSLPPDSKLRSDLTAPKYKILEGNTIAIESKEDMKKRIGRSPDRGDAVVYAWMQTPRRTVSVFADYEDDEYESNHVHVVPRGEVNR